MIEPLLALYLIIGCALSLIIWWIAFQPDFDDFCRDQLGEEPLTSSQKVTVIILTPLVWPVTLLRMFSHG
jgi:hypothetical protein